MCYESHLLCPQLPMEMVPAGGWVYGSLLSWGSARVQAVPPSADVCVAVSATAWHSPPAAPQPLSRLAAWVCQGGVGDTTAACPWPVCAATLGSPGQCLEVELRLPYLVHWTGFCH